MTILLTGGTGKTSIRLARLLLKADQQILLTSRSGVAPSPFPAVRFDWFDTTTYDNPFQLATKPIDKVYLVAPPVVDSFTPMKAFIDFAIKRNVKRFVLLSATVFIRGKYLVGHVHEYLASIGVDYCVLRPSWFMENFAEQDHHLRSIKEEDRIYSASNDGRLPWISADDIADVAFSALLDAKSHNTDHIIVGPALYAYDDVARILSKILGRPITHVRLSPEAYRQHCISYIGTSEEYLPWRLAMEKHISQGLEEDEFYSPGKISGRRWLPDVLESEKGCWMK